ncbi:MAG: hypothetical protein HGA19_21835 [Oscillochloris sp.]|nr:hypothetical protein [Oscillochloris sp.]
MIQDTLIPSIRYCHPRSGGQIRGWYALAGKQHCCHYAESFWIVRLVDN